MYIYCNIIYTVAVAAVSLRGHGFFFSRRIHAMENATNERLLQMRGVCLEGFPRNRAKIQPHLNPESWLFSAGSKKQAVRPV